MVALDAKWLEQKNKDATERYKIISTKHSYVPWWTGLRRECDECGTVFELGERADADARYCINELRDRISFGCPVCTKPHIFKKEENEVKL
jgi:hypothetical protein